MKSVMIFFICFSFYQINAQNPDFGKEWVSGGAFNYKVTFTNNSANVNYLFKKYYFEDGQSSICDSNGSILVVSDGINIRDRNLDIMENGDIIVDNEYLGLYNYSSGYSQSTLILPLSNNMFYVITSFASDTMIDYWLSGSKKAPFDKLQYNIVDMNQNGGLGKATGKKIPIMEGRLLSKTQMMACRHANGNDWWLLKVAHDSTIIMKFLITKDSISYKGDFNFNHIVTPGFLAQGDSSIWEIMGMLTFSNDGKHLATACNSGHSELFMADFDRCSGNISNPVYQKIPLLPTNWPVTDHLIDSSVTGLCYSPNDRFLYVIKYTNIWQWDLQNPDSATAWYQVANMDTTYDYFQGYSTSYLGYDNKIYVGNWNGIGFGMSTINNPDEKGAACNFCPKCLPFQQGGASNYPCMPNWNLGVQNCDSEVIHPPIIIEEPVTIPNAFSPNDDGLNDAWRILNVDVLQYAGYTMQAVGVYNRWGTEVFKGNDINFEWNGKGWASDAYYYYIRYRTKEGVTRIQKGTVTIVR